MLLRFLAILGLVLLAGCATMSSSPPSTFRSDRISVQVLGEGPDVLLIPGLSSSPRVWEGSVAAVPGYRYHIVQVAGFAGAAAGANSAGPVVEPVAAEIARYLGETHLDHVAVVGHSLGGIWAMEVAARVPDRVSRVMVVDMLPFPGMLFGGPAATRESLAPVAAQVREMLARTAGEDRRRLAETTLAGMIRDEAARPGPVADYLASDPQVSAQAMADLITTDLRPELPHVRAPMTVLWVRAPNAPMTEEQMAQLYAQSYAGAPRVTIRHVPDAYHFIMLDQPELFHQALRQFLAQG